MSKPSNIERVLIDLFKSKSEYAKLLEKDLRGELSWNAIVTILSPARDRHLKALEGAVVTGYALTRKYNENS